MRTLFAALFATVAVAPLAAQNREVARAGARPRVVTGQEIELTEKQREKIASIRERYAKQEEARLKSFRDERIKMQKELDGVYTREQRARIESRRAESADVEARAWATEERVARAMPRMRVEADEMARTMRDMPRVRIEATEMARVAREMSAMGVRMARMPRVAMPVEDMRADEVRVEGERVREEAMKARIEGMRAREMGDRIREEGMRMRVEGRAMRDDMPRVVGPGVIIRRGMAPRMVEVPDEAPEAPRKAVRGRVIERDTPVEAPAPPRMPRRARPAVEAPAPAPPKPEIDR